MDEGGKRVAWVELYLDLVFLFQGEGAYAIVDDINYLGEVFAS